jgi:hypothetical protein
MFNKEAYYGWRLCAATFLSIIIIQSQLYSNYKFIFLSAQGKEIRNSIWAIEDANVEQGNSEKNESDVRASLNDRGEISERASLHVDYFIVCDGPF